MHDLAGDALLTVLVVVTAGALLTLAEVADPLDPHRQRHRWRSPASDARWVLVWLAVVPVGGALAGVLPGWPTPGEPVAGSLPLAVRTAAALVLYDAVAYATHRAMHAHPRLRRWHAVHHGSRELRWWTTFRFHPADTVVSHAVPLAAVGLAGLGADAAGAAVAVVAVVTLLAHADVWLPDRFGGLVTTPALHRRHHDPATAHTHFALVLPAWDHIFGTVADQPPTNAEITRPASNDATFAIALVDTDDHPPTRPTRVNTQASHSTIASSSAANPGTVSVNAGHSAPRARNAAGCDVAFATSAAVTARPTPAPARTNPATTIGTSTTNVASSETA